METEKFETEREFNLRFPSKIYICSNCGALTDNALECKRCKWRADGLFKTAGKGYRYTIEETGITKEIFRPIEKV